VSDWLNGGELTEGEALLAAIDTTTPWGRPLHFDIAYAGPEPDPDDPDDTQEIIDGAYELALIDLEAARPACGCTVLRILVDVDLDDPKVVRQRYGHGNPACRWEQAQQASRS
jgi:hypothetical protein